MSSSKALAFNGRAWVGLVAKFLSFVGRFPVLFLILPSIWFFARYLPFWKDVDVLNELVWPFTSDNLLLCPPVYPVIGRTVFWLTDFLTTGGAPDPLSPQHPSLLAVYALITLQHLSLWFGLCYFVHAFRGSQANRGLIILVLAAVASFYSFAHTAGAEATIAPTWFMVFGAGLRILSRRGNWLTWTIYSVALFLSIGSRHVSAFLLTWLPVTALLLIGASSLGIQSVISSGTLVRIGFGSLAISVVAFATEQMIVTQLCQMFGVVQHRSLGRTLSDRIGSFLDTLPAAERSRVAAQAEKFSRDPDVTNAIESIWRTGPYHQGTEDVIAARLRARGLSGQALEVESDRIILAAVTAYYRTLDPRLAIVIVRDIGRGFYPENDFGIAMTGPKSTDFSLPRIAADPVAWQGIDRLPLFHPDVARATLERAYHDVWLRHWRWMPFGAWLLVFVAIGIWRSQRQTLAGAGWILAMSMFGIGLVTYAATCACNYTMPRYAFPLLVGIFAAAGVLMGYKEKHESANGREGERAKSLLASAG